MRIMDPRFSTPMQHNAASKNYESKLDLDL